VYISSRRDFSQADKRRAAAHDISAGVDGQENSKRFDPAVFKVRTFEYRFAGEVAVAGTVTDPKTWTNCRRYEMTGHPTTYC
jgi:hypothetical protein